MQLQPILRLVLGLEVFALVWVLARRFSRPQVSGNQSALDGMAECARGAPHWPIPRSEVPWPTGRDLDDKQAIRDRLLHAEWFTVTELARALQKAPLGRKPSGSAGRDARMLAARWVDEGTLELQYFGPSGRAFYRFV
jgi:hypothetical protein